jgi:isoleucyl-tRNA synthetase
MEVDYSKTLCLPRTDFPMKANLPQKEPEILRKWAEMDIYRRIREERKGCPLYILHDGPPYANGDVHLGTALNKILKDIVVKYKTLKGYDSPYVPGWDCHGMPIEHGVMAELGERGKGMKAKEIRALCRDYALKYVGIQREQFKRLGVFGDWDNPYLTLSPSYERHIIRAFREISRNGYIYRDLKPVLWCPRCQTALAEAEIEYYDVESPSIYVRFRVKSGIEKAFGDKLSGKEVSFVIWTTTPWTLPANFAIALHPDYIYSAIDVGGEVLIMAEELSAQVLSEIGIGEWRELASAPGRDLEGIVCSHPFLQRDSIVVIGDYVRKEATGCVHIAPGHGQEDYVTGVRYGLPVYAPVDENGRFTEDVPEWEGLFVFDADPHIIRRLEEEGALLSSKRIIHPYPHCWRCKSQLIFRATRQWFLSLDANSLREEALKAADSVNWIPDWSKDRFKNTLASRPDWCLSRQRVWGVPIPVLYCKDCGEAVISDEFIEGFEMLVAEKGVDPWFEDEETIPVPTEGIRCPRCGGSSFRKEMDIFDVWLESGLSWASVLDSPEFRLLFPSDLYLEAVDQHRGWFQSSMILSMSVKGTPPYKSVLTHGLIVDEKGRKMSKSLGNVIPPERIINKYGADVMRLWVGFVDYTQEMRISEESIGSVADAYRKIRNTWRFMLGNLYDFDPDRDKVGYEELMEVDKWILHRLWEVAIKADRAYERCDFRTAVQAIYELCSSDLSSFYLDISKDRLYTMAPDSFERRSAQTAIYEILLNLVKLLSPVIPFTAEETWGYIRGRKEESVHISRWSPEDLEGYRNEEVARRWGLLLEVRDEVLKALEEKRRSKVIGSSLEAEVELYASNRDLLSLLSGFRDQLPMIFITSGASVSDDSSLPPDATMAEEIEGLYIRVLPARGRKCPRCWVWSEEIGKDPSYPDLCPRCADVMRRIGFGEGGSR